jgi:hypothetical protein
MVAIGDSDVVSDVVSDAQGRAHNPIENEGRSGAESTNISVLLSTYLCIYSTINYEPVVLYIVCKFNYEETEERIDHNKIIIPGGVCPQYLIVAWRRA